MMTRLDSKDELIKELIAHLTTVNGNGAGRRQGGGGSSNRECSCGGGGKPSGSNGSGDGKQKPIQWRTEKFDDKWHSGKKAAWHCAQLRDTNPALYKNNQAP